MTCACCSSGMIATETASSCDGALLALVIAVDCVAAATTAAGVAGAVWLGDALSEPAATSLRSVGKGDAIGGVSVGAGWVGVANAWISSLADGADVGAIGCCSTSHETQRPHPSASIAKVTTGRFCVPRSCLRMNGNANRPTRAHFQDVLTADTLMIVEFRCLSE